MVDLADLSEDKLPPAYTIVTQTLGELGFRRLYVGARAQIGQWHSLNAQDFTRHLIALLGFRTADRSTITANEAETITHEELTAFSRAFQEHQGNIVDGLDRADVEDDIEYTTRAIRTYMARNKGALDLPDALDSYFIGVPKNSKLRNRRATEYLYEAIAAPRAEMPRIEYDHLRNPIDDTNKILGAIGQEITRMGDLAERSAMLQASLNEQATEAIEKMEKAASATEANANKALRVARRGIGIAVASLVVSAGLAAWEQYRDSNDKAAEIVAAQREREADRALMRQQVEAIKRKRRPDPTFPQLM